MLYQARKAGVTRMLVPGTDTTTSRRALEIAEHEDGVFAAVGIHPHHVFEMYVKLAQDISNIDLILNEEVAELKEMLKMPKAVALGETGIDRHMYVKTKYQEYNVTEDFVKIQVEVFKTHLLLALEYNKSLVIHNREAQEDLLAALAEMWDSKLEGRVVFHCCEASDKLLDYAKQHKIYIGVDGDITYGDEKKNFIKKVPREMLVIETDAPYLLPEPLRSEKKYPNNPANITLIAQAVADAWSTNIQDVEKITEENGKKLFQVS